MSRIIHVCGPKEGRWVRFVEGSSMDFSVDLSAESVESASLSLEGVDDVHSGDSLSLGVLAVGDGVTDDVLKEDLQNSTGLFIDESGDTLDSTTASKTTDSWLGDSLDVVAKNFAMALGTSFSESFSSFSTSGHCCSID